MKEVRRYLNRFREKVFSQRFPEYITNDKKVHILYLSCYGNGTGLYRFILPCMHLNTTTTHSAIISTVHTWDYFNQFKDLQMACDNRLIKWADYIVFPTVFSPLLNEMTTLHQVNPRLQYVMDIDDNYHALPENHPLIKSFTPGMRRDLLKNIGSMDFITAPNANLLLYYKNLMAEAYPQREVLQIVPSYNLLSPFLIEKREEQNKPEVKFDKVRIGMIVSPHHFNDVNAFKDVLKELQQKYKDRIELIVMGWDGKWNMKNALEGVQFTYVPPTSPVKYFEAIGKLKLDIGIIPLRNDQEFNHYKSFQRWSEFAAFNIPVVCGDSEVYAPIIEQNQNGYIARTKEEWMLILSTLIEDEDKRQEIGFNAYQSVWQNYSWTPYFLDSLKKNFIKMPEEEKLKINAL